MGLPAWKPTRDVGRTQEKLVNHEPKGYDDDDDTFIKVSKL